MDSFSVYEYTDIVLSVVDKIVASIIGRSFLDYSHAIIMRKEDFQLYARIKQGILEANIGLTGEFHGIQLGGLFITTDTGGNNCFPLLFHEIGHSFYPVDNNHYINDFQATYFQILCIKKLEIELSHIGVYISYPDSYNEYESPTNYHKKAFDDAKLFFGLQSIYKFIKGDEKYEKLLDDNLKIVE